MIEYCLHKVVGLNYFDCSLKKAGNVFFLKVDVFFDRCHILNISNVDLYFSRDFLGTEFSSASLAKVSMSSEVSKSSPTIPLS